MNYAALVQIVGTSSSLRTYNRRAILGALIAIAPASRADLAKRAGLSQVTAGKIVDEMLDEGLVHEIAAQAQRERRLGRPGRMLQLNPRYTPLLAVNLGTEKTRIARASIGLNRDDQWQHEFITPQSSADWRKLMTKACKDLCTEQVEAVVVSIPGVVDERSGEVLLAPNLHWLEESGLPAMVAEITGKPVTLLQEARALAYGQIAIEQAQGIPSDFLLVDFSDGLGAAAAVGNKVYVGPLALNGELGHTPVVGNHRKCGCGAVGCIETLVSRRGLLQSFAAATGVRTARWDDLTKHIAAEGVQPWLQDSLSHVATAIAAAANVMGLQRVIITGSITDLPATVVEHLSESVIQGCMWRRFGQMICHGAPRHLLAGLVAAGVDRVIMPVRLESRL